LKLPTSRQYSKNLQVVTACKHNDMLALQAGRRISRNRKQKYLIQDVKIARATRRLEMDQITVKAFLISVSRTTYNPMRHIAADPLPASENPVVYRRRINLNQEACHDSDSC
jgi:hypothetical protein